MLHVPGFRPREVSALINRSVVEEHAEDAGSLWRMHEHGIRAPLYRLRDLFLLDQRVLAHLDGLRIAGQAGFTLARRALATEEPGAVFVVAYLAFAASERETMRQVVQLAVANPTFLNALVAALAWLDFEQIQEPLNLLAQSRNSGYRRVAIAVAAAHRVQYRDAYGNAAIDADPVLRARAFRAIGETKCTDLVDLLHKGMRSPDHECRFWAAWSMALFGDERAASSAYEAGTAEPRFSRLAIETAMRVGDPSWARGLVKALARDDSKTRQAIIAAGAFGDPVVVPWLLIKLEEPTVAKVAAEAIATITGVDLEAAECKQDPPDEMPDELDEDADLRWPSPQGLTDWWNREEGRFTSGVRFLAGLPISEAATLEVLRTGYQRQRRAAAVEFSRLREEGILFPTSARADWQQRRLSL